MVGSTVAREADDVIITQAGPEIAVASTKAYTSQLIAFYLLGLYLARIRGTRSEAELAEVVKDLEELPEQAERTLERRGHPPSWPRNRQTGRPVLHRQGAGLRRRPGGLPEAEGDLLHSFRGLCRRGAEARHPGPDRGGRAGDRPRHPDVPLRQNGEQHRGSEGPGRPGVGDGPGGGRQSFTNWRMRC